MADAIPIQCPDCGATLKLRDATRLGKMLRCPRCDARFVAASLDDEKDFFGFLDEEALPTSPSAGSERRRPRHQSDEPDNNWLATNRSLLAKVGAVGVLLIATLAILLLRDAKLSPRKIDLAYLPAATDSVTYVRVADLWNASFMEEFVRNERIEKLVEAMREEIGFRPSEIDSILIGSVADVDPLFPKSVAVVRTQKPIDLMAILERYRGLQQDKHEGTTFYRFASRNFFGMETACYLADSQTAVVGEEAFIKEAISSGGQVVASAEFAAVESRHHVWMVSRIRDLPPASGPDENLQQLGAMLPDTIGQLVAKHRPHVRVIRFGIALHNEVAVHAELETPTANAATDLRTACQEQLDVLKKYVAELIALSDTVKPLQDVVDGIKVARDGSTVTLHADLPKSLKKQTDQLANVIGSYEFQTAYKTMLRKTYTRTVPDHVAEQIRAKGMRLAPQKGGAFLVVPSGSHATDDDLVLLKDVPGLHDLTIASDSITDAGMRHVGEVHFLQSLRLEGAVQLTNDSAEIIGKLTSLTHLDLSGTRVDDDGLSHLAGLKNVRQINLYNTSVTEVGAAALKQHLPTTRILLARRTGPPFQNPNFPEMNVNSRPHPNAGIAAPANRPGPGETRVPAGPNAPPLVIVSAVYGVNQSWLDVTDKVQATVKGLASWSKTVSNDDWGDPAPGYEVGNTLIVHYLSNGNERLAREYQGKRIHLSAMPAAGSDQLPPIANAPQLHVITALYGVNQSWFNVTDKVREHIGERSSWSVVVDDADWGDPAPNYQPGNTLIIRYSSAGTIRTTAQFAGRTLELP